MSNTTSKIGPVYTKQEAAELLKVHPKTIDRWIASGKLRAWRYADSRVVRISERDLLKLRKPVTSLADEVNA